MMKFVLGLTKKNIFEGKEFLKTFVIINVHLIL